jgi:uncharacterized repeat protein (TIGR02543 family)
MKNSVNRFFKIFSISILTLIILGFICSSFSSAKAETALQGEGEVSLETISAIKLDRQPYSIGVNEETNRIYIGLNDSLVILDGTNKQMLSKISNITFANKVLVDSKNNKVFVENSSNLCVIDGATNSVLGSIPLSFSKSFAVDTERNLIYVGQSETFYRNVNDRVAVYDEKTLNYQYRIGIPGSASTQFHSVYVSVNPKLNRIYATWSGNSSAIYVFDSNTSQLLIIGQITNGYSDFLGIDPATNYIHFANETLDGASLQSVPHLDLGTLAPATIFDSTYGVIYACRTENDSYVPFPYKLSIIDSLTNTVFATVNLGMSWGYGPHIAANSKIGEIYLTNFQQNEITIVEGLSPVRPILTSNLAVNPTRVETGKTITISYQAANLASNSTTYTPSLILNASALLQQQIQLESKEIRTIQFTTNIIVPGNYTVNAGGLTANLTVYAPTSLVTFKTNGIGNDISSATILTIDSTQYTYAQLQSLTFNWTSGSSHIINVSNSISTISSSKRYAFVDWTNANGISGGTGMYIVPSLSTTVISNWKTQYYFTAVTLYGSASGSGWYDSGTLVSATLSATTVPRMQGTQYVFTGWTGDITDSASTSNPITVTKPIVATANWKEQYLIWLIETPSGSGSINPSETGLWVDPSILSITANASSGYMFSQWISSTDSISIFNSTSTSTTANINGPGNITANFALSPTTPPTPPVTSPSSTPEVTQSPAIPEIAPAIAIIAFALATLILAVSARGFSKRRRI